MKSILVTAGLVLLASRAFALDITTCGQTVPSGEDGVLTVDLTGCASDVPAVILADKASLSMESHVITSGANGVLCQRRCTISGPGEISGVASHGVNLPNAKSRLTIDQVSIHDNGDSGIDAQGDFTAAGASKIRMTNVDITANIGGGVFVWRGSVQGENVSINENHGFGISGIKKFKLVNAEVRENWLDGMIVPFGGGKVISSSVILNGIFPSHADISTLKRPRVIDTGCTHSAQYINGFSRTDMPWGVCALD